MSTAHAVVLLLDEKSQIQALDRTQPGLPIKPARCQTMTHDYRRHGTTTLFAALSVLDAIASSSEARASNQRCTMHAGLLRVSTGPTQPHAALSSLRFAYQGGLHPAQRLSGYPNVSPDLISRYGCLI
jgi:hypothetical protein